jgi:hypothetical protein
MRKNIIEKFTRFYNGDKTIVFYQQEIEHRDRMLFVLEEKMADLTITDLDLYKKVKEKFDISYPAVLQDITVIERIIANSLNPSGDPQKTFIRYFIAEGIKKAIKIAETKQDAKAMAMALNTLGKHFLTDKEDIVKPDYEKIIPFNPEITSDPSVIGIELPENFEEIREKYRQKFAQDYQNFIRKMAIPEAIEIKENEDGE